MNLFHLLVCLILAPFSYAFYGPPRDVPDIKLGLHWTTFNIGRDIYSYGLNYPEYGPKVTDFNVSKFGIDENKNLYSKRYHVDNLEFFCLYCFSFVLSNDSVLTITGYDGTVDTNVQLENMGVYYFNPVENTINKDSAYNMLPGSPARRVLHQAVMTPEKKSVYIFGGLSQDNVTQTNLNITQFDISSSTFISHNNFSFIGGTATMLPSGIAVLAFGASGINELNGESLYDTSSVFLYDTNKNKLYKQNISGIPPPPRVEASGTLGPDNECIYYFGGDDFDVQINYLSASFENYTGMRERLHVRTDLVILNTTSWTWFSPDVSGPPNIGRYGHFSLLYEDNTLIIGGGSTRAGERNDISVLRNLPLDGESSNFDNLQWFTNSEMDKIYNGDADKNTLSVGAIIGIVIGSIILALIIFYFIWKKTSGLKRIIWKRRLGEPAWTEILRNIIRVILLGVLLAYIVYAVIRAIDSPSLNEERVIEKKKIPLSDIRLCTTSSYADASFDIACNFQNDQDCSKYFYQITNITLFPKFQTVFESIECKVFAPPLDISFERNDATYDAESVGSIYIDVFGKNTDQNPEAFYATYYTNQNSPYRTLLGLNNEELTMSIQNAYDLIDKEHTSYNMINTVKIDLLNNVTVEYLLTETLSLTNSSWNYFGFANIYDESLDITQNAGATVSMFNFSDIYLPLSMLIVKPSEYAIHRITEQKVSTILSGLASAGGVFSIIIAIQTLLFGFRPNSPWGIIQRWSCGITRRSLRNKLRDGFSTDNAPVPMATRVRDDYHLLPTSSISTALEMASLNEGNDDKSIELKFRKMEDRMQLMEDLFKAYYIDDEVFQKLNEARKNNARNDDEKQKKANSITSFTRLNQEYEEMSINQTGQHKDSRFLP